MKQAEYETMSNNRDPGGLEEQLTYRHSSLRLTRRLGVHLALGLPALRSLAHT